MTHSDTSPGSGPPSGRGDALGFALQVAGERAALVLRDRDFFGWLRVERLELEIPGLSFPMDLSGGAGRFQRRRCRVTRAVLALDDAGLGALLQARAASLATAGFEDVRGRILDGGVELSGRARVGERAAEFTARVWPIADRGMLRLLAGELRAYAPLRRAGSLVAHDLLLALSEQAPQSAASEWARVPSVVTQSALDLLEAGQAVFAQSRALADVELEPLEQFLWRTLPPAGWRLPDARHVRVTQVGLARGRLAVTFAGPDEEAAPPHRPPAADRRVVAPVEQRAADERLVRGDEMGALAMWRAEASRRGPDAFDVSERLVELLLTRESNFREAEEVARQALARAPELPWAHLALALVAVERGRTAEAIEHFTQARDAARARGEDEDAARAALAAARLIRDVDAARATPLWEAALELRPGNAEASEALAERYAAEERWSDLVRLSRRRLAATHDRKEQAREHLRLGELLLVRLRDPQAARAEFQRATELSEGDARAWEGLGRALATLGDSVAAAAAFERVIALASARGDGVGEARALARRAELAERAGDESGARTRLERAAQLAPTDAAVLERLAGLCARAGDREGAIAAWTRVLDLPAGATGDRHRRATCALGKLLLDADRLDQAHQVLAAIGEDEDPERLALLAELERRQGHLAESEAALARAVQACADDGRRAELLVEHAAILEQLDRSGIAAAVLLQAAELVPEGAGGLRAARVLAEAARTRGDSAEEARWLDRVLAGANALGAPALHDLAELSLRRGELALHAGAVELAREYLETALRSGSGSGADAATLRHARALLAEARAQLGDHAGEAQLLDRLAEDEDDQGARLDFYTAAAVAHLGAGDVATALERARRATALGPDSAAALAVLLEAAWQARAWDDVIAAAEALVPLTEGARRAEAARRLGSALIERGRERDAVIALRAAVEVHDASAETIVGARRKLADLLEKLGDHGAAATALSEGAVDPRTGEPPAARAMQHFRAGELLRKRLHDPIGAAAELEAALRLDAEHMPALDALETIHAESGDIARVAALLGRKIAATARQPERRKALLARLAELQAGPLGRPDAAREAYKRALELDPGFRPALRFLAPDAMARGDEVEAYRLYSRLAAPAGPQEGEDAALIAGERADALIMLAQLARRAGQELDELAHLLRAIALQPERDDALAALIESLGKAGRFSEVAEMWGRRAVLAPDENTRADFEVRRAQVLAEQLGDHRHALDVVQRALERAPRHVGLLNLRAACAHVLDEPRDLAEALTALGNLDGAADAWEQALEDTPDDRAAAIALAQVHERRHDHAAERAALEHVLRIVRKTSAGPAAERAALADIASRARADGDFARAREALADSARLAPGDGMLLRERAEVAALAGDFAECAALLEDLVNGAPEHDEGKREVKTELYVELAEVCEQRLRDLSRARSALRRGALLAPDGPRRQGLLRRWAELAAEAGADAETQQALSALPEGSRTVADWVSLARAFAAQGRDQDAISAFEGAQAAGAIDDAEALELFSLYRRTDETRKLAGALERSAGRAQPPAARSRLEEALALYKGPLADAEAVARVSDALRAMGVQPTDAATRAAELEAAGQLEEAVPLLAEALAEEARQRATANETLGDAGRELLLRLRGAARATRQFESLAQGLLWAAAAEHDAGTAASWLAEAAAVRSAHLSDPAGAADALGRALALAPLDAGIARDLESLLREQGDFARLLDVYELRLRHLQGATRAPVLFDLGRIWADAFGEPARAAACWAEASALDPARSDVLLPLAEFHAREGEAQPAIDYFRRALAAGVVAPGDRADVHARVGVLLLLLGEGRAALTELEAAVAEQPGHALAEARLDDALRAADEWEALALRLHARGRAGGLHGERLAALHEAAALYDDRLEDREQADAIYKEILALDPGDATAAARVRLSTPAPSPESLELAAGRAEEDAGRTEAAIAHYENAWQQSSSPAAVDALWRIATASDDHEYQAELIGRRLLLAGEDRALRADLWVERAMLYRDVLHREPEAYRCLKEAVACSPSHPEATVLLRAYAVARGEWALCAELLYREIAAHPDPVDKAALHVELALVYEERLLDVESAVRNHETARSLDPSGPVPAPALARLYAQMGRLSEAAHAEEEAAQFALDPDGRSARLARAAAHWERAGDLTEASRLYRSAAAVAGAGDPARAAAARLDRLPGAPPDLAETRARLQARLSETQDPEEKLDVLRRLLAAAVSAAEDEEIDKRAQEVLARDSLDVTAFVERRRVLIGREAWLALAPHLRARAEAIDDPAERASLFFELGRLHASRLRDQARAALAFEEALRADPGHSAALDALADIAYRQHDWERARTLYRRLDEHASTLGADVVWFRRGELAEAMGLEEEAEGAYRAAAHANPAHVPALEALARLALVRGELTSAIAALEMVLEQLPLDDVERLTALRQQLGELCHRTGDTRAARHWFELVLAEEPGRPNALSPMSELYGLSGEWERAAETLGKLSQLAASPERRADLLFRMGEIYRIHLGQDDRAADAYLKAIDLDADHVPTLRRLCDFYWQDGDHQSLDEIAGELEARASLTVPETPPETLARVAVAAEMNGGHARAAAVARALGPAGAGPLAAALAEGRARRPGDETALVNAAKRLCMPPGPPLAAVKAVLAARGPKDPAAEALATRL